MKREARFLGIDDSPFVFGDGRTRLVGVVTRGASYVEGVLTSWATVDGTDATDRILAMVSSSRFRPLLRAIFLNGVTVGGFNVVDVAALHEGLGVPVVAVVRRAPDAERAEAALRKHFPDAAQRVRQLASLRPVRAANGRFDVWVHARGVSESALGALLAGVTVRGAIPEPVRLAHVIASGVARGESRGPA